MCIRDSITMHIQVYTSENPPRLVEKNKSGRLIFNGVTERYLSEGSALFDRIHLREVTSHYRKGWVFLVVRPTLSDGLFLRIPNKNIIDPKKIQPYIFQDVIVKAKRVKFPKQRPRVAIPMPLPINEPPVKTNSEKTE
eukprot:TRINITY_DN28284_c0_g1_i1.p2 TRINITY_DN28284_c0_g1~~TRINITY_DN28284_c0_g1_i1.p2  ORF type:complete len:158 (+),score=39.84 TRINITY_DN28284_c0_g1_i1:61-474(+)